MQGSLAPAVIVVPPMSMPGNPCFTIEAGALSLPEHRIHVHERGVCQLKWTVMLLSREHHNLTNAGHGGLDDLVTEVKRVAGPEPIQCAR